MILEAGAARGGNPFITYVSLPTPRARGSLLTSLNPPSSRGPPPPPVVRHRESAQNTKSATGVIFVMGGVALQGWRTRVRGVGAAGIRVGIPATPASARV